MSETAFGLAPMLAAAAPLLAPLFTAWGSPVTLLETVAFMLSLAMVACNLRVNPWAWPLAMAASAAYALLFAASRLYGEAGLQLFFIAVSAWGWWQWLHDTTPGHDSATLGVRWMALAPRLQAAALTLMAWPLLGLLLARATDTDVPFADALPTVASVTGQVLLGRKRVENWLVWLAVNVFSVGLFAWKALWLTALLYAVFAVLSVVGYRAWAALARQADGQSAA